MVVIACRLLTIVRQQLVGWERRWRARDLIWYHVVCSRCGDTEESVLDIFEGPMHGVDVHDDRQRGLTTSNLSSSEWNICCGAWLI